MKLKYGLDDRPPFLETLAYGLQWLALTIPALVIIGQVVAGVHFAEIQEQILYLQKLCFITGLLLIAQVLWGHGMPLVIGPSTVLLIGILSSQGSSLDSIYSAIFLGGVVLAVLAYSGLFSLVQGLFTPRVVVVILLLIAFTMSPTIMKLIIGDGTVPLIYNILFTGGSLSAGDDLDELGYFDLDDLPDLAFPTDRKVLEMLRQYLSGVIL
jgi:xanthine/uracil permease